MRVLHVITGLNTGGAEMMLYKLLAHTDRARFEPMVLSLRDKGTLGERIEALGIGVHTGNLKASPGLLPGTFDLVRAIRKLKPDLIQGWMYHANLAALVGASALPQQVPVLWNVRSGAAPLHQEKRLTQAIIRLSGLFSRFPSYVVHNSVAGADAHEAMLGYRTSNRKVIPNGFDLAMFKPDQEARWKVRAELGIAPDVPLIGLVGRFHPVKNHEGFINSLSFLVKHMPEVQLVMAGRDVKPDNAALMRVVTDAGLSERVHLLGERQDIPRLTAALDVSCSASLSEGFPNVVGEAMACGVPCVVTDVGDSAWLVGETGLVVPPGDDRAMAEAFHHFFKMTHPQRQALGNKARVRVETMFGMHAVASQYEQLYEAAYSRSAHSAG